MPFGFSFGKKPVVPAVRTLTAEEQAREADEERQVNSVKALTKILSAESDKSLTQISKEVFGRLKNTNPARSKELTNLHTKLAGVDLGAAFHFLYTVKGKEGPAPVPIMHAPAAAVVAGSAPAAAVVAGSAPAAAVGSAIVPATVPVQYIQPSGFQAVGPAQGFQKGITSARNQALASTGSGLRNVFGKMGFGSKGGAQTRRNLRKRKSRGTNKAKRQH
jgi:hypothetical protein